MDNLLKMSYNKEKVEGGLIMSNYTDADRKRDFDFFTKNYHELYKQYGHKFLAIKNEEVIGAYDSVPDAISQLSPTYEIGTYIIQECTGDDSAYRTTIMRLIIKG